MKYYDIKGAKAFIEERKESIDIASLGMHEDWFWTAETIFENGCFVAHIDHEDFTIGGIFSSQWATPSLQIVYKDGSNDMVPCFLTDGNEVPFGEKVANSIAATSGVLSSAVQENIKPLNE